MQCLLLLCISGSLVPSSAAADTSKEALAIIDRAIEAQGGERFAKKTQKAQVHGVVKGFVPGFGEGTVEINDLFDRPSNFKRIARIERKDGKTTTIFVVRGDKTWVKMDDKETVERKSFPSDATQAHWYLSLLDLSAAKDKELDLSVKGEEKYDGKEVTVVRAKAAGFQADLSFDKKSGLLVRSVRELSNPESDTKTVVESTFGDYKDVDGVKLPFKLIVTQDGKELMSIAIKEVKFFDKIDEAEFAKP